jgi:xanthine/CO dehydrogenase XdhC/CoxF family maturation factor
VVLASVLATRGATPRKQGRARMLVDADTHAHSIGGGAMAEARVIAAARTLLAAQRTRAEVRGRSERRADAAGVCGGRMRLALRRWAGRGRPRARAGDRARAGRGRPVGRTRAMSARPMAPRCSRPTRAW